MPKNKIFLSCPLLYSVLKYGVETFMSSFVFGSQKVGKMKSILTDCFYEELQFKTVDDPVKGETNCNYVFTEEKYNFIMIL